ncbi:hypothetical protein N7495_008120 [Penicillium taxi]|uniref:uncharacterized protein n=1 Tax=Penicillium taxi TaxID=168475 RepID=UPI0025453576|nr:uncharacterized protein N7495_008120 [Penicillium taxi]KAJ5888079.1 hypothetical protein N7495_008120 [Penicillium taxi]
MIVILLVDLHPRIGTACMHSLASSSPLLPSYQLKSSELIFSGCIMQYGKSHVRDLALQVADCGLRIADYGLRIAEY